MLNFHSLCGAKPVHFIEVAFYERPCGRDATDTDPCGLGASYCNDAQVIAVEHAVTDVLETHAANELAVISPYAAQVALLRERLPDSVEVLSVDACQGREKPVIIFSTVRANSCGKIGFLADTRRINVAFTRAERALIIIGHRATLEQEYRTWRPWLHWVDEFGVVSDWSSICDPCNDNDCCDARGGSSANDYDAQ